MEVGAPVPWGVEHHVWGEDPRLKLLCPTHFEIRPQSFLSAVSDEVTFNFFVHVCPLCTVCFEVVAHCMRFYVPSDWKLVICSNFCVRKHWERDTKVHDHCLF